MTRTLALVRPPGPDLESGLRTHVERRRLDLAAALAGHARYCEALEELGCEVRSLEPLVGCPDACFVEDPAVVLGEVAVLGRMGDPSRAPEVPALASVLSEFRELCELPVGVLEGGDVLVVDDVLYTGLSARTDHPGMRALAHAVLEHGYRVKAVHVKGALHLKTAITWLGEDVLLANPRWVDLERFAGMRVVEVDPAEPFGANVQRVGASVLASSAYPRTLERVADAGFEVRPVDLSELHAAEAGVTCLAQLLSLT